MNQAQRAYNSYDSGHYQIIYDYDEKENKIKVSRNE